ncbi:MAG: DUF4230 domain-containing protein [Muribaculaceae bacterium]|nr:DUF4230 domain-containing protein [Muribaculaceae bacterium]
MPKRLFMKAFAAVPKNRFTKAFAAVLLAASGALVFGGCSHKEVQEPERIDVYQELRDVSKLQLARMTVGKVGTIADPEFDKAKGFMEKAEAVFDKMKIGTRIGVYSYDTYLSAYIDLSELRPEDVRVDDQTMTAKVTLPPIKVEYDGRDIELREEHYRVSGLRSQITPAERASLKEQMNREVKREIASDKGFRDRVRESGRQKGISYFENLLRNWGYEPTVTFRQ